MRRFISVQFVPMRDTFCMVVLRFVCATRIIPVFFRVLKHLCMLFPTAYLLFQTVVTAVSFVAGNFVQSTSASWASLAAGLVTFERSSNARSHSILFCTEYEMERVQRGKLTSIVLKVCKYVCRHDSLRLQMCKYFCIVSLSVAHTTFKAAGTVLVRTSIY